MEHIEEEVVVDELSVFLDVKIIYHGHYFLQIHMFREETTQVAYVQLMRLTITSSSGCNGTEQ